MPRRFRPPYSIGEARCAFRRALRQQPRSCLIRLGKGFAKVRAVKFPGDRRQLQDFRRSGAVEAIAGRVDLAALAGKMANSINVSRALQSTYLPQTAAVVRLADEARARGRSRMREARDGKK
jgi:hypothetical protein